MPKIHLSSSPLLSRVFISFAAFSMIVFSTSPSLAETVYARGRIAATGTPAGVHFPPCNVQTREHAKNIGQQIRDRALDAVGKATSALGLGGDPFNTRRLNQSNCVDLCVVVPQGAQFTARGSIAGQYPWQGDLPSGLPGRIDPQNWAGIDGPVVEPSGRGDVVCYTFYNWSDNLDRIIGIEVKY